MFRSLKRYFGALSPQVGSDKGRLTVVMDLDETLCHVFAPDDVTGYNFKPDIQEDFFIKFPEKRSSLFIYKRPHLDEFLDYLGANFEPVVWGTGVKEYVDRVVDAIDPKGIFRHRLYQDQCSYERAQGYPQFEFLKDISIIPRDQGRIVVVDDDWQGMYKQVDNFLYIEKYEAWYEDDWLKNDIPRFLNDLKDLPDVRPYLRARFMLKYAWAEDQQLYKLSSEDHLMAEFLSRHDHTEYDKIREKYDQLFKIQSPFIPEHKLW